MRCARLSFPYRRCFREVLHEVLRESVGTHLPHREYQKQFAVA